MANKSCQGSLIEIDFNWQSVLFTMKLTQKRQVQTIDHFVQPLICLLTYYENWPSLSLYSSHMRQTLSFTTTYLHIFIPNKGEYIIIIVINLYCIHLSWLTNNAVLISPIYKNQIIFNVINYIFFWFQFLIPVAMVPSSSKHTRPIYTFS